jgi:broad specificity phosphatase PhoE
MGRLILIRHGESVGNRERVFASNPQELPLTELGYQQAQDAGAAIEELFRAELVVTSPYLRARETARVIAAVLGVPLEIEPDLHERDFGALRGKPYDSILTTPGYDPKSPWTWKPEGGESFEDVEVRVGPVLDRLAQDHLSRDVVVVSHGAVMKTLWAYITRDRDGARVPHNCGMILVECGPGGYSPPQVIGQALPSGSDPANKQRFGSWT